MSPVTFFILLLFFMIPNLAVANSETELMKGKVVKQLSFPEDAEFGTVHIQAVIDVPPQTVWKMLVHLEEWGQWMPSLTEGWFYSKEAMQHLPDPFPKDRNLSLELRKKYPGAEGAVNPFFVGEEVRMAYENYDLLWPIRNEWVVRKYFYDSREAGLNKFKASWAQVFNRNQKTEGYWLLEPFQNDPARTLLTYHYWVRAKAGLSRVVFKWGVQLFINRMMDHLKNEAEHQKKQVSAL